MSCYKKDCMHFFENQCLMEKCIAFACPDDCELYNVVINIRHTSLIGKPALLVNSSYGKLSSTQQKLLNDLREERFLKIEKRFDKLKITMKDLSCMTAVTDLEFSLFERNDMYILVKGTNHSVPLRKDEAGYLVNSHFKWIGHTHPGHSKYCLYPSDGDRRMLMLFSQESSTIYNSIGDFLIFDKEEKLCQ